MTKVWIKDEEKKPREKSNPLWVKCRKCATWNAKEIREVLTYVDRYFKQIEEKLAAMKGTEAHDEIAVDEPEGTPQP